MSKNILKISIVGLIILCGCSTPPAPDSGFLENYRKLEKSPKIAFNDYWSIDGLDFGKYKTVDIAEIDTTHLLKNDWWDQFNLTSSSSSIKEASKLAQIFKQKLAENFKNSQGMPEYLPGATDGIRIELAITEVVPTKVWLNSISYLLLGGVDEGTTSIEGRIRDLKTGEIIAMFKDREHGQSGILVNIADLTWYSHALHTIDYWSLLLSELVHSKPEDKIEGRYKFTLKPY